jgi:hypothetical protein
MGLGDKGEIIITSSEEESDTDDREFIEQVDVADSDEFFASASESESDYDWADENDDFIIE